MLLFLDTADPAALRDLNGTGLVDGLVIRSSMIAKTGRPMLEVIAEFCDIVEGPISAAVAGGEAEIMARRGMELSEIALNVVVRLPPTREGFAAANRLAEESVRTHITPCSSAAQALLAVKAGADYISPFVGGPDKPLERGLAVLKDTRLIYDRFGFHTKILCGSITCVEDLTLAAQHGCDVAAVSPSVFAELFKHPLTQLGLDADLDD